MILPAAESQKYADRLDQMLLQLKNEILLQSKNANLVRANDRDWDEYLLELNTYYYTSFHQKFFPLYRQIIARDTRSLYNISHQEATLKNDVLTSIKQQAHLFNKVKSIAALLQVKRAETNQLLLASCLGNDELNVELLYILKELTHDWADFREHVGKLQTLLEDQKLLNILKKYPAHVAVANLISQWEDSMKADRDLKRLMAGWQLAIKLLVKLQQNQAPTKENTRAVKAELDKIDVSWDNRKTPTTARTWYKQYIQPTYVFYLELINLYSEKSDFKHSSRVAGQMEEWLQALLFYLEQSLLYRSRGDGELIANAFHLTRMDGAYLQELATYSSRLLPSLDELIDTLASSSQADYQNHSQRSSQVLGEVYQFCKLQLDNKVKPRGILLFAQMERLQNKIALLASQIDLLDQKATHAVAIAKQLQLSLDMLDSLLTLLLGILEELKKPLNPRNISSNFSEIDIQIDYIPLKVGDLFPSHLLYLIPNGPIATQSSNARPNQILHTEGDIFIIKLDDLKEVIIPKVIIAREG